MQNSATKSQHIANVWQQSLNFQFQYLELDCLLEALEDSLDPPLLLIASGVDTHTRTHTHAHAHTQTHTQTRTHTAQNKAISRSQARAWLKTQ